jgi:hypothetical protein
MTKEEVQELLEYIRACKEVKGWLRATYGTPKELWHRCPTSFFGLYREDPIAAWRCWEKHLPEFLEQWPWEVVEPMLMKKLQDYRNRGQ